MKKKTHPLSTFALVALLSLAGCSSDDKLSSSEEQKMKDGFAQKGFDPNKLTPQQKAGMEKYAGGLAPTSPPPGKK
ncbi:hypothetical protein BH11ARM2_BH11ARM2_27470 [soil metagenome]